MRTWTKSLKQKKKPNIISLTNDQIVYDGCCDEMHPSPEDVDTKKHQLYDVGSKS